ncbi:large conductance mechanosensitive channel protein MscL [Tessaracoccus sp. OH4464_COT-324]|uniref:large conductance mechanosensitive channel protein MscL n=1 Tax=Tessaracoccus sp. OH4464_COT-324 TaxID=2491059 RepID=UPI000F632674|nr:large conductance mechanosensitive channel protein MscL [Tessaracoccus sp. OH4464_COT-324]RRD45864.1 large conductance mechanosensitive channel protein MscL [Tessaracoccus sp. OH4464_COT-324]
MQGFKEFIMRGNLIELAVAFIMGTAFAAVVDSFTKLIMDLIGLIGGNPDFSQVTVGPINIGNFITALVGFLIVAAVLYFFVVKPYNFAKTRFMKAEEEKPEEPTAEEKLLEEIRDLLAKRNA